MESELSVLISDRKNSLHASIGSSCSFTKFEIEGSFVPGGGGGEGGCLSGGIGGSLYERSEGDFEHTSGTVSLHVIGNGNGGSRGGRGGGCGVLW